MQPTPYQIDLMRHACGMGSKSPFFRNYFAACPGDKDDHEWDEIVKGGFAVLRMHPDEMFPYNLYSVTPEGKKAMEETP